MSMPNTPAELQAYARGVESGRTAQRLDGHEERLDKINGSMDRLSAVVQDLVNEIRTVRRDSTEMARVAAEVASARAIDKQREDEQAAKRWTTSQRIIGLIAAMIMIAQFVMLLLGLR
jgi:citrate synthase